MQDTVLNVAMTRVHFTNKINKLKENASNCTRRLAHDLDYRIVLPITCTVCSLFYWNSPSNHMYCIIIAYSIVCTITCINCTVLLFIRCGLWVGHSLYKRH